MGSGRGWYLLPFIGATSLALVLLICMIVCTMMNVHTMPANDYDKPIDNEPIDDAECPLRAPDDERPTEGYQTARRG